MTAERRSDPHVETIRERLRDRAAAGLRKYGVNTTRGDLATADWLRHAQDEALDLAVYLETLIGRQPEPAAIDAVVESSGEAARLSMALRNVRARLHAANRPALKEGLRIELRDYIDGVLAGARP